MHSSESSKWKTASHASRGFEVFDNTNPFQALLPSDCFQNKIAEFQLQGQFTPSIRNFKDYSFLASSTEGHIRIVW